MKKFLVLLSMFVAIPTQLACCGHNTLESYYRYKEAQQDLDFNRRRVGQDPQNTENLAHILSWQKGQEAEKRAKIKMALQVLKMVIAMIHPD